MRHTKKQRDAFEAWALAQKKANKSRDKNLERIITILDKELFKLTVKADKTIDPALKQEADEAYARYRKIALPHRIANRKRPKSAVRR